MNKNLLSFFGLKRNPFLPDVPIEGLYKLPRFESFAWRIENLVMDGGIAAIFGEPGLGKSVMLRQIYYRLSEIKDITVARIERPQSSLSDFYREICDVFAVESRIGNRYNSFNSLRERWKQHIETSLFRAVLLIDETQEMQDGVLSELRLLTSDQFDSRRLLTIVFAGDMRLYDRFNSRELLPLRSRIRTKLIAEPLTRDELIKMLTHALTSAGNKQLMSPGLMETIADHSAGNPRVLMLSCDELLMKAVLLEKTQLDEKLFFEVFQEKLPKRKLK